MLTAPVMGLIPAQPPEAAHEVAFVEDHVSVPLPPLRTVPGLALIATVTFPEDIVGTLDPVRPGADPHPDRIAANVPRANKCGRGDNTGTLARARGKTES